MIAMTTTIKDLNWETYEGRTYGYYDIPGTDTSIEIEISERIVRSMWTTGTNVRSWNIVDDYNNPIADGEAEGLRAAKTAVMKALNVYLKENK